jgi:hypothetical protein
MLIIIADARLMSRLRRAAYSRGISMIGATGDGGTSAGAVGAGADTSGAGGAGTACVNGACGLCCG